MGRRAPALLGLRLYERLNIPCNIATTGPCAVPAAVMSVVQEKELLLREGMRILGLQVRLPCRLYSIVGAILCCVHCAGGWFG